jgi:hypothetical protein
MSKTSAVPSVVLKTGFSFNTYVLMISPVILVLLSLIYEVNLSSLIFYLPVGSILFYVSFCRYSCRIEVSGAGEMKIIYFFPWNKNRIINLTEYKYIDYGRGFYVFIIFLDAEKLF